MLAVFYLILAIVLVGTNVGRKKTGKGKCEDKKQTVQVIEGKGVKCEVVGDRLNTVFLEEEV